MTQPVAPMSSPRSSPWLRLRQPAFLSAVVVLLIAAVTLNAATKYMKLYFKKEPVSLRHELDTLPTQLGHWVQVSKDEPLDREIEDVLGTKKYIFRDFVDANQITESERNELTKDQSVADYRKVLGALQAAKPAAVITCAVTYYTGMVDTVAHIPDRCYVADGFEPTEHAYPMLTLPARDNAPSRPLQVCFISFEDQIPTRAVVPIKVAYFFQCNGSYESDPINGVRFRLQSLTEKHGYYAKVELKTVMPDSQQSQDVMSDFLSYALPEIERCLPDWQAVTRDEHKLADASASPASHISSPVSSPASSPISSGGH